MFRSAFAIALAAVFATELPSRTNDLLSGLVPVTMTVTANVDKGKRPPEIAKEDVFVKKGKERLNVTGWVPAKGDRAGMELFILIDDASTSTLGVHLDDLRTFVKAQAPSTYVGIGYARNGTVEIRQNFTTDLELASGGLRLPMGNVGAFGSPYLSVVDLMKRWPQSDNRRQIVLVTDGIDRARRGPNSVLNPDVDTAADVAQRTGTMIHTIYFPGVGHWHRNFWQATNGQNGLAKLSGITGGESFYLGTQDPVSLVPYLDDLQRSMDNQYRLTFLTSPGKKAGFQYVNITTEIAGVDIAAADAAWVPVSK
jgi:hypothetical protein